MNVFDTADSMQTYALSQRTGGKRIALVPTMGNLHDGHLELVRQARQQCDILIVSIFVNPTQFGPREDYGAYPRTLKDDLKKCEQEGVDAVFAPTVEGMYGGDTGVVVSVEGWGERLCGSSRPGHFQGVTTVVMKLLNICQPHVAVFGWKDAQQFLILRRMARALNVPVEMVGVETVRETDGLAMSSRNQYLSNEERAQAPALYHALKYAHSMAETGNLDAGEIIEAVKDHITRNSSAVIDYVEIVSMQNLEPLITVAVGQTLLAAAIRFPSARLIDNCRL